MSKKQFFDFLPKDPMYPVLQGLLSFGILVVSYLLGDHAPIIGIFAVIFGAMTILGVFLVPTKKRDV